jgi:hypothetical protein
VSQSALLLLALAAATPFENATRRYEALDYEAACPLFEEAARSGARVDRARAFMWAGVCRGQLGKFDDAKKRFREALALDRKAELPADAPPKVKALFEAERAAIAAPVVVVEPADTTPPVTTTSASTSTPPPPEQTKQPVTLSAPVAMVAGGAALVAVAAGATILAAIAGSTAVADDHRVQAARADVTTPGDQVVQLTHDRDGAALAANAAFATTAVSAASGIGLIVAGVIAGE